MPRKRLASFKYASHGIWQALKDGPNLQIHILFGIIAILLGLIFQITYFEWLIIILLIGLVISLELTNTAIEETVDYFTQNLHPGAKRAKDVAAGAVLIAAITALIIGLFIFLPYIIQYLTF